MFADPTTRLPDSDPVQTIESSSNTSPTLASDVVQRAMEDFEYDPDKLDPASV